MLKQWTKLLALLAVAATCSSAGAITFTATDTDPMGIQYTATVTSLGGNLYNVSLTINTSGYNGTKPAWLDWVNLKVSPQDPSSVSNFSLPASWSYAGASAGKVLFKSVSVGGSGSAPESSDIPIPVGGGPTVNFSYRVDLTGTSLKLDEWPYQARYLFYEGTNPRGQPRYTQTIVSRTMTPQGGVIPEPATLLLFGMGLAAPLAARWRKR